MKKIISLILCAAMLSSAFAASAREFVHVSDWAYNDVSVFTREGLLTTGFADVTDYRRNITRGQFVELMCSVLIKTGSINTEYLDDYLYNRFEDIGDNFYYKLAAARHLVEGEALETMTDEYGNVTVTRARLHPDETITRQDAARLAEETLSYAGGRPYTAYPYYDDSGSELDYSLKLTFADKDKVADYAAHSVYMLSDMGIIQGVGENLFDPLGSMTIEQAIAIMYRIYRLSPHSPKPDGDGIEADTEQTVKEYGGGWIETKLGDTLYVKKDGVSLAFDTDIYSNIYCAATSDGSVYAAAQTYSDNTDIFNVLTGELIKTIPLCAYNADSEYIYTKSADTGLTKYGLCDFAGNEVLPAEYSLTEIDELRKNNFARADAPTRDAAGWIYYADWEDGGHMYKADSNGNNKQKISDSDCYDISFHDGWIYYHTRGDAEGSLFCMKPDGTGVTRLTKGRCYDVNDTFLCYEDGSPLSPDDTLNKPYLFFEDAVYDEEGNYAGSTLYRLTHEDGGTQIKQLTDIDVITTSIPAKDKSEKNWIYFKDYGKRSEDEPSKVYRTDGDIVECVNENIMTDFTFPMRSKDGQRLLQVSSWYNEETKESKTDVVTDMELNYLEDYDEKKIEQDYLKDDSTIIFMDEIASGEQTERRIDSLSDDSYSVYLQDDGTMYCRDKNGAERLISTVSSAVVYTSSYFRYGNKLYWLQYEDTGMILSMDMSTGETKTLARDVATRNYAQASSLYPVTDKVMFFTDNGGNVFRLDFGTDNISEIYPNSNYNLCGDVFALYPMEHEKTLLKIDTDGNYCDILSGVDVHYLIYVPDDAPVSRPFTDFSNSIVWVQDYVWCYRLGE